MNPELFDRLESAFGELLKALDGQDANAIKAAAGEIVPLLAAMGSSEEQLKQLDLDGQLDRLVSLIESTRVRVNKLTDINRHRIDILTPALGKTPMQVYQRP